MRAETARSFPHAAPVEFATVPAYGAAADVRRYDEY